MGGELKPVPIGVGGDPAERTVHVVDQVVEILACESAQATPIRQDPSGIRQPLNEPHEQLVAEDYLQVTKILGGDEGDALTADDRAELVGEDVADELGRGHIGAKHPAIMDATFSVPILERAVAPCAGGDPDRGKLQDHRGDRWARSRSAHAGPWRFQRDRARVRLSWLPPPSRACSSGQSGVLDVGSRSANLALDPDKPVWTRRS
jgi:hypothetical protein